MGVSAVVLVMSDHDGYVFVVVLAYAGDRDGAVAMLLLLLDDLGVAAANVIIRV